LNARAAGLKKIVKLVNDERNLCTRRALLLQVCAGVVGASLQAGGRMPPTSNRPSVERDSFRIRALDRKYDLHREKGCTLLAIEVANWPGNEFGLWLPETVYLSEKVVWGNWWSNAHQEFEENSRGVWTTKRAFNQFMVISKLTPDPARSCMWYRHTFRNTGNETLRELNSQTCFHLVNAPQFISLRGSRIWANLDGQWMTTDKVERDQSPDPRRVAFFRRGVRSERTVIPWEGFAGATMPEAAFHPLFIAENFQGNASVGIAARNFEKLFNNNDPILRCLHSESMPVRQLEPGQSAHQDSVVIFYNGDHRAILEHYTNHIEPNWPSS
jgi:hypothetical protein